MTILDLLLILAVFAFVLAAAQGCRLHFGRGGKFGDGLKNLLELGNQGVGFRHGKQPHADFGAVSFTKARAAERDLRRRTRSLSCRRTEVSGDSRISI